MRQPQLLQCKCRCTLSLYRSSSLLFFWVVLDSRDDRLWLSQSKWKKWRRRKVFRLFVVVVVIVEHVCSAAPKKTMKKNFERRKKSLEAFNKRKTMTRAQAALFHRQIEIWIGPSSSFCGLRKRIQQMEGAHSHAHATSVHRAALVDGGWIGKRRKK